jgi:hypothetical protein
MLKNDTIEQNKDKTNLIQFITFYKSLITLNEKIQNKKIKKLFKKYE